MMIIQACLFHQGSGLNRYSATHPHYDTKPIWTGRRLAHMNKTVKAYIRPTPVWSRDHSPYHKTQTKAHRPFLLLHIPPCTKGGGMLRTSTPPATSPQITLDSGKRSPGNPYHPRLLDPDVVSGQAIFRWRSHRSPVELCSVMAGEAPNAYVNCQGSKWPKRWPQETNHYTHVRRRESLEHLRTWDGGRRGLILLATSGS